MKLITIAFEVDDLPLKLYNQIIREISRLVGNRIVRVEVVTVPRVPVQLPLVLHRKRA